MTENLVSKLFEIDYVLILNEWLCKSVNEKR